MKVARVIEMQNMDKEAVKKYGISEELLMENAGQAVYNIIAKYFNIKTSSFFVICGSGNNGGDGLVVARKLYSNGAMVTICLLGTPENFKGAAQKNWQIIKNIGLPVLFTPSIEEINSSIKTNDLIVDAIFGTGLNRAITGYYYQVIHLINSKNNPVFSIDIPSGVNGDNGSINKIAIKADYTISFGLPKVGNILYPGFSFGGKLFVDHISFPPDLYNNEQLCIQINNSTSLPARQPDGHKGTFGNALFIAGSPHYYGAPYFASLSFLKSGGGYSRLAAPSSLIPSLGSMASEVVYLPQKETEAGTISLEAFDHLVQWSEKSDIVVIGPGLSLQDETQILIRKLVLEIKKPLIVDGDGLTSLNENISILNKRVMPTVLTPHMGELARLLKIPISEILREPIQVIQNFCKHFNAIVVAKGAHSLICLPDGNTYINMTGNNGMATAGTGDILTGTVAAMFTLGLPLEQAVRQGVLVHGLAGDLAAAEKGKDGIIASDILKFLPLAVKEIREISEPFSDCNYININVV